MNSMFRISSEDDVAIFIVDMDGPVSVTNDAEQVVRWLYEQGKLQKDQHLYYYDSDGRCDELEHDGNGRFTAFSFGVKPKRSLIL